MINRLIILTLFLCPACQSGRLPCSEIKSAQIKKSTVNKPLRQFLASLSNEVDNGNNEIVTIKNYRSSEDRHVSNVTEEEWDCPRPGKRKYMPKSIKENIRKNFKKINSDQHKKSRDSLQSK